MKPPDFTTLKLFKLALAVTILQISVAQDAVLTLDISGKSFDAGTLRIANPVSVTFTASTLESFSTCLCNKTTQNCTVPFKAGAAPPNQFDTSLTRQDSPVAVHEYNMSSHYTCQVPNLYNATNNRGDFITCNRVQMLDLNCSFSKHCFKFNTEDSCDLDSIFLTWVTYQNVTYLPKSGPNTTLSACLPDCTNISVDSTTSGISITSTASVPTPQADKSSDTDVLAIVIGIVVAAVVVIAVIAVAVIVRKRKSKRRHSSMTKDIMGTTTFTSDNAFSKAPTMTQAVTSTTNIETSSKASNRYSLDTVNSNGPPITANDETPQVINSSYELATLNVENEQGALSEHNNNNSSNRHSHNSHSPVVFEHPKNVNGQVKNSTEINEVKVVGLDSEADPKLAKETGVDGQVKNNLEPNEVNSSDSDDDYETFKNSKKKKMNPYNVLLKPKEDPKGRAPMSTPTVSSSPLTQRQFGASGNVAGKENLIEGGQEISGLKIPEIIEVKPDSFKTKNKDKKRNIRVTSSDDYDYPTFGQVSTIEEDEIYNVPDNEDDDEFMYSFTTDAVPETTKPKVESDEDSDYSDVDVKNSADIPDQDSESQTYYYSEHTLEAKETEQAQSVSDTGAKISTDIPEDDNVSQTYYYSQHNLLAKTSDNSNGVVENSEENQDFKVPENTQKMSDVDVNIEAHISEGSKKRESVRGDDEEYEDIGSVRAEFSKNHSN